MRKSRKMLGIFLAVSLVSASLAGCGGKNPDAPAEKVTEAKGQEGNGKEQAGGAEKGSSKDTLTVALTNEPPSLTTCDHDSIISVYMNVLTYNGLMRIDNNTLAVVPDLAAEYSVENDTDWTFTLKDGIKFHNGKDLYGGGRCRQHRMGKVLPGKFQLYQKYQIHRSGGCPNGKDCDRRAVCRTSGGSGLPL